jgi:hypothetical protein
MDAATNQLVQQIEASNLPVVVERDLPTLGEAPAAGAAAVAAEASN